MIDKKFVIDSIKMDLYRVVTASGDITRDLPLKSIEEFLNHADKDFEKINLTPRENILRKELKKLRKYLKKLKDLKSRLRWTEDVLTIRCRL